MPIQGRGSDRRLPLLERPTPGTKPRALASLPPFPPVAARLMRLASKETHSLKKISDLVRTDAAISAEVLRMANSAVFGVRYEVSSILQAITLMGLDRLKGLVLTVALRDLLSSVGHHECLTRCWRHDLACALVSEELAEPCWIDRGHGYTAGLLHDVGRLALLATHAEAYERLFEVADSGANLLQRERETFELDHCQAGYWLAADWGLPQDLVEVIAFHHEPFAGDLFGLRDLVSIACRLSDSIGFFVAGEPPPLDRQWLQSKLPASAWAKFEPRLNALAHDVAVRINLFECDFSYSRPPLIVAGS